MAPLVSVVIPVADDLTHLQRAVASVTRQSHKPVEAVVVHSGDPDRVPASLREHSAVTYEYQEPRGVAAARNRALELAAGSIVGFCDADDYWHPDKLATQLPVLDGDADVVYADEYLLRDGSYHRIDAPRVRDPGRHHVDVFRNGGGIGSRSVLARAACFESERFDERFAVREDQHLWIRLFAAFTPAHVAEPLSVKCERPGSLSADVDRAHRMERLEIDDLCARFPELRPHRAERERQMRYRYAKRLLADEGRAAEARGVLWRLLADGGADERAIALLALSALPIDHRAATRRLQRWLWTLQAYRRRVAGSDRTDRTVPPPTPGDGLDDAV